MNASFVSRKNVTLALLFLLALTLSGCDRCTPVTLKTIELQPGRIAQGTPGVRGSSGWCLSSGNPPASSFSPGPRQIIVGFDNFFEAGSDPFPCDDIRAVVFRGAVPFDVTQFDSVVTVELLFDAQSSIVRNSGGTAGTIPGVSHATTLGVATPPLTGQLLFDNDASLPGGSSFNIGVSGQVRDWIGGKPNLGFVLAGPTGLVNPSNPPENNDAKVTWYGNFRLRVVYNPALNPRAPQ